MLKISCSTLFLFCVFRISSAQSPALSINDNLNNFVNTAKIAETSGYGQSGRIYRDSYLYADQNLGGSYSGSSSSGYNVNNPAHFFNPRLSYIYTHFEGRRLNGYYRDLESWRKAERARLKKEGLWGRDSIEQLYAP